MGIIEFNNVYYRYPRLEDSARGTSLHKARETSLQVVSPVKNALDGINLTVDKGEFLAVMGENGSGKTTLCRLINGLIPHHSRGSLTGSVTVDGINTKESSVPNLALVAGMVLDDPDAQLFTSSVFNEAAFGPENILLTEEEIKERVKFALGAAGLSGYEDRLPSTL